MARTIQPQVGVVVVIVIYVGMFTTFFPETCLDTSLSSLSMRCSMQLCPPIYEVTCTLPLSPPLDYIKLHKSQVLWRKCRAPLV